MSLRKPLMVAGILLLLTSSNATGRLIDGGNVTIKGQSFGTFTVDVMADTVWLDLSGFYDWNYDAVETFLQGTAYAIADASDITILDITTSGQDLDEYAAIVGAFRAPINQYSYAMYNNDMVDNDSFLAGTTLSDENVPNDPILRNSYLPDRYFNMVNMSTWVLSSSTTPEAVPEPTTALLFGTGLLGLIGMGRRRRR